MLRIASPLLVSRALAVVSLLGAVEPAVAQVTAADVIDRPSLRAFVERAADLSESRISDATDAYDFFDRTFRPEGEWRKGSIYLFVLETDRTMFFHAVNRDLEGTRLNRLDKNGVPIRQELIAAAEAGGGFVEYLFDNPDVSGDEEDGSPKVSYAAPLPLGERDVVIVSGFYPPDSVPIAPPLAQLLLAMLLAGGAYRRWRRR